jgi:hypothetical protein
MRSKQWAGFLCPIETCYERSKYGAQATRYPQCALGFDIAIAYEPAPRLKPKLAKKKKTHTQSTKGALCDLAHWQKYAVVLA